MIRSSASKSLKKQPKSPKKGMGESNVGSMPRAEPMGRGRGGVKPLPRKGGRGFCGWVAGDLHAVRPKGLGGFIIYNI